MTTVESNVSYYICYTAVYDTILIVSLILNVLLLAYKGFTPVVIRLARTV